uniref:Uncharacterized protein n=1 Tax=Anguilla anguilla TaxID=7936 RepID=A0A0E9XD25_ANGAN
MDILQYFKIYRVLLEAVGNAHVKNESIYTTFIKNKKKSHGVCWFMFLCLRDGTAVAGGIMFSGCLSVRPSRFS